MYMYIMPCHFLSTFPQSVQKCARHEHSTACQYFSTFHRRFKDVHDMNIPEFLSTLPQRLHGYRHGRLSKCTGHVLLVLPMLTGGEMWMDQAVDICLLANTLVLITPRADEPLS